LHSGFSSQKTNWHVKGESSVNTKDQAHHRLLNAVVSFRGADQNGSKEEVRVAAIELEAAQKESQELLYPK
jgi:hypothetical protein